MNPIYGDFTSGHYFGISDRERQERLLEMVAAQELEARQNSVEETQKTRHWRAALLAILAVIIAAALDWFR